MVVPLWLAVVYVLGAALEWLGLAMKDYAGERLKRRWFPRPPGDDDEEDARRRKR